MHYELAQVPNLVVYAGSNLKEGIAASPRKIIIRDTPIGRMVVVICSDLLLEDSPHRKIFKDMRANLIIVPAMTSVVEPDFIDAAEEFAEHCQAVTIVCNACCLPRESLSSKKDDIKVSVAYYPRPPSKWWRRCNNVPGECTSHRCLREFILSLDAHPLGFE
jgi:predicted amidohydrolase